MIFGNPFFEKLPCILNQVKDEYKQELITHLKMSAMIYFGKYTAEWLEKHYQMINENTFFLC